MYTIKIDINGTERTFAGDADMMLNNDWQQIIMGFLGDAQNAYETD